ncbi:MAG TPA: glycosyl hydrolase family 8 [Acidimicrobiales bacterium]|nr:glycosyl hydrolase family 8 [Acidimicrobiales bacterium]
MTSAPPTARPTRGLPPRARVPGDRTRRGQTRRLVTAVVVPLVVAGAVAALSLQGGHVPGAPTVTGPAPSDPVGHARYDAKAFLTRYLGSDGRVVRHDQGGDTVSEGQGYAMLLAVAVGDRSDFDLAWRWARAHLQLPDKLFAYHWADGAVVGADPAADADLDTAWALALAARRFDDPAYRTPAVQIAAAILANETVSPGGRPQLVAGPWARPAPSVMDPSYLAPQAMALLRVTTQDARWAAVEDDAVGALTSLQQAAGRRLPPDWASLSASGAVSPARAPGTTTPPAYGLDAQRVPVWLAASCSAPARALAAAWWPMLDHASGAGADLSYSLAGASRTAVVNPLGLVAAAAAAAAAGQRAAAAKLLDRADAQAGRYHTYYGDAWVALGRVLLDTTWLSPCPPLVR